MSRWKDDKVFKFGKIAVYTTKGSQDDPRRFYTEVHKDGRYWSSHGSNMPFRFLAAVEAVWKMPRSQDD